MRQANQAMRICVVNVLNRPDWQTRPEADTVQADATYPLPGLDMLLTRLRKPLTSRGDWYRYGDSNPGYMAENHVS